MIGESLFEKFRFIPPSGLNAVEPLYQKFLGWIESPAIQDQPKFKLIGYYDPELLIFSIRKLLKQCPKAKKEIRIAIYQTNYPEPAILMQAEDTDHPDRWMCLMPRVEEK